jgi:hypothetical protein
MSKETISRRTFLKVGGTSVTATAAVIVRPACAAAPATAVTPQTSHTLLPYVLPRRSGPRREPLCNSPIQTPLRHALQ